LLAALKTRLSAAMTFSIALHAFALFGIALVLPATHKASDFMQPLQVVLVNSKSKSRPAKADALAQANLDGGGNTADDRQAKSRFPPYATTSNLPPNNSPNAANNSKKNPGG